ncbi:hypothetical protein L249_8357, partial [Ophiocordyceps polyrhachis-furcata BCC 54312]
VCLLKSVGKVESNEVFCGAVEEEEGGEKLVESLCGSRDREEEDESRDSGFMRIEEELKAGEVGKPPSFIDKFLNNKGDLEEDFNVMDQPDDLTLRVDRCDDHLQRADRCDGCLVPRSIGCYDRYRYSAPIAVTIAVTSRSGAMTAIAPL